MAVGNTVSGTVTLSGFVCNFSAHSTGTSSMTQTETSATITYTLTFSMTVSRSVPAQQRVGGTVSVSGSIAGFSGTGSLSFSLTNTTSQAKTVSQTKSCTLVASKSTTYTKGTGAQAIAGLFSATAASKTSSGSASNTVPALTSHTVSYNANGGSGSISAQTKYYGQNITLSNGSGFSRTNYQLLRWNTNSGGTGTNYNLGQSYTVNSTTNITLYAQWLFLYSKPTVINLTVSRCNSSGTAQEDGTYIKVLFDYAGGLLGPSGSQTQVAPKMLITIDGNEVYRDETSTDTTGSFSQVFGSAYSINTTHPVVIKLWDDNDTTGTTAGTSVSTTVFPMDILEDGSAMGLMMPAQSGHMLSVPELSIQVDEAASTGTDGIIVSAMNALGWDSDVFS